MPAFLLFLVRFVRLLLSGNQAVAIENAALRLQLAAFQRQRKRPVLTAFDRLFWVGLSRVWRGWRGPMFSRHRRPVEARARSPVLGPCVQSGLPTPRQTHNPDRGAPSHRPDGGGQSALACATASRELQMLGIQISERDCFAHSPPAASAADSNVEDVSSHGCVAVSKEWLAVSLKRPITATRPVIFKMASDGACNDSLCRPLVSSIRYRDVEELLEERGLDADHTTVWRWVQRYGPELERRMRHHLKADQQGLACGRDV